MAPSQQNLARLQGLLQVQDPACLLQALELARSLDDPSVWATLTQGLSWRPPDKDGRGRTYGTLVGYPSGSAAERAWQRSTQLALLGHCPEGTPGAALRGTITSLELDGYLRFGLFPKLDLDWLSKFHNLERLRLVAFDPLINLSRLAGLPRLRELTLFASRVPEGIDGLAGAPALESLEVHNGNALARPLRDLPALRSLTVNYGEPGLGLEALRDLRGLQVLTLTNHQVADFTPLSALVGLKSVRVQEQQTHSLRGLERMPSLEVLAVTRGAFTDLEPLRGARGLRELQVTWTPSLTSLEALRGITTLTRVDLGGSSVRDVDALEACALESFEWHGCKELSSLAGLRGTRAITHLVSNHPTKLRSLEGLENLPGLLRLSLAASPELTSLAALRGLRSLSEVRLGQADALTSLDGLQGCDALSIVQVHSATLTDISALTGLPKVSILDLSGCGALADLSALTTLPGLRALGLHGTRFKRGELPPALRAVATFAREAKLHALASKPRQAPRKAVPAGVPEGKGRQYLHLRKLLLSRDEAQIDQGLELLRALGDPSYYDVLLKGVTWDTTLSPRKDLGAFGFDASVLRCTGPARPYRQRLLLGLVAAAPEGCPSAQALKETVTSMALWAPTAGKVRSAVDLAPLAVFARIESLRLEAFGAVTHPEALGKLTGLRSLDLVSLALDALPPLSDLVALERLKVHSQVSDVSAVAALLWLKELHLASAALLALPPLRELSRLEKVQLDYCRALPEVSFKGCAALRTLSLGYLHALRALDLTGCTALETLILNGSPSLDVVRGLETLTKLKRIVAESASGPWINHGELPELPSLEDLRLTWFPRADTAFASRLTALKSLSLRGAANLQDLSGLAALGALESLDLRNCGKVSDLTALAGLTKLREVLLHGTAVDRKALPKHLQRVAR